MRHMFEKGFGLFWLVESVARMKASCWNRIELERDLVYDQNFYLGGNGGGWGGGSSEKCLKGGH